MIKRIPDFLTSYLLPVLLFGGLYLTGLHTPVLAFLQRGILATGVLQPDVALPQEGGAAGAAQAGNLDFRMVDAAGTAIDARSLAGKVIFLNFWASWCPPCLAELPNIDALYARFADDDRVAFILLNVEEDFSQGLAYVGRHGYGFPVYHLRGGLPERLRSGTLPTTYVISPAGKMVVAHKGMAQYDTDKFRALLDGLVGAGR